MRNIKHCFFLLVNQEKQCYIFEGDAVPWGCSRPRSLKGGHSMDSKDGTGGIAAPREDVRPPHTISQAARRLNTSDQATRNAVLRGELDGFRIGRSWRITPESVDRKLAGETA